MKIVVLLPQLHAPSELALNQLVRRKDLEIVGVLRSDISPFRSQYWKYAAYGVGRAGIFYGVLIALTAYLHLIGLGIASLLIWNRRRKWLSVDTLVRRNGIPIHNTSNINSKASRAILKSWQPDILVCLSFDQILKKSVLEIPQTAALNVHPGLLPQYRGIWPNFWKLHNREKYAGVTIHHMNEQIDRGEVIAQTKFLIRSDDTKFSLALRSAHYGTQLLVQTLDKIKKGIPLVPLKLRGKAKYYSLPTKKHFDNFFARGKKLFSVQEMRREMLRLF